METSKKRREREREREREAHNPTCIKMNQELQTIYKAGHILTGLRKFPFVLFTKIARLSLYNGVM